MARRPLASGPALDASLLAGLMLGLLDACGAWLRGSSEIALLAVTSAIGCSLVSAAMVCVWVLGRTLEPIEERRAGARTVAVGGAAVVHAFPWVFTALRTMHDGGAMSWFSVLVGFGIATLAYVVGRRTPSFLVWLAASAITVWAVERATESVHLRARVDPFAPDVHFLLLLTASMFGIGMAWTIARVASVAAENRPTRHVRHGVVWLAVGVLAWSLATFAFPGLYDVPRRLLHGAGTMGVLAGMLGLGVRVPSAARTIIGILVAFGASLLFFVPALSKLEWSVASATSLARDVVASVGNRRTSLMEDLRYTPAAERGRNIAREANEWNARHRGPLPNLRTVLLVSIDSLRFDACGWAAGKAGVTPHFDALAARSVRFRRAHAHGTWTSISVPTMLWGRPPHLLRFVPLAEDEFRRLHFVGEFPADRRPLKAFQSPRNEPSSNVAELMGGAGWSTTAVLNDGWTGYFEPALGFSRGFHEVHHRDLLPEDGVEESSDAYTADVAIARIERARPDERLFVWVHFFGPHDPRSEHPLDGMSPYETDIHESDRQLGRLLDSLSRNGRADTLVFVLSDHGDAFGDHGKAGHGLDVFQEVAHVPLVVFHPSLPARDVHEEVGLSDVPVTVLHAVGIDVPEAMVGFSLMPFARGEDVDRPPVLLETWRRDIRTLEPSIHVVGAIEDRFKVLLDLRTGAMACHDLAMDPGEHTPLSGMEPRDLGRFRDLAGYLVGARGL